MIRQAILLSLLVLLVLICWHVGACQAARYRHDGQAVLPDPKLTPGRTDPSLTSQKLCNAAYHTRDDRHVTESMKKKACDEYGQSSCPGRGYEVDHLISIELGGAEDLTNLWPQPADARGVIGYHTKDVVENRAHRAVCAGKMPLKQAQQGISNDWYKFGKAHGWIN